MRPLLVGLALFASVTNAQIVVSSGNEPPKPAKVEWMQCIAIMGNLTAYSAPIYFLDDSPTRMRVAKEFENYVRSQFGSASFGSCSSIFGSPMYEDPKENKPTNWTGGYPTDMPRHTGPRSSRPASRAASDVSLRPAPQPKGPTPNQLKYQREMEAYKARLAEIERIKADTATRHAADQAAARQQIASHDSDMARHRQEVAAADAARRRYQEELEAQQRRVTEMETKADRERKVEWREAIVVCELRPSDGQSKFGNWSCEGPLQMTYAKLGAAGAGLNKQALVALSQACGGSEQSVRDLGMVNGARLFGCSFGLHPKALDLRSTDQALRHGISYVPGRATYRCPAYKSYCRTQ